MKRTTASLALVILLLAGASAFIAIRYARSGNVDRAPRVAATDDIAVTSGVAGTFDRESFNGEVRFTPKEIRNANPSDGLTAAPGDKWIVFSGSASNGTERAFDMQQFIATVADANGNTFKAQEDKVKPLGGVFGVRPGVQWTEQISYEVPATFVPAKIVLLPFDRKHEAFLIAVGVADYTSS